MATTILVVDDKASVRTVVRDYLTEDGFRVVTAENGRDALYVARHEKPDLILLDIMMPEMSGYDFLRAYRKERNTPVILLTARLEESDKVLGLELGADDYVTKPFGIREVVARIRAVLRRAGPGAAPTAVLRAGDLVLDLDAHTVRSGDQPIRLTPSEFELLAALMAAPGRAFSRAGTARTATGHRHRRRRAHGRIRTSITCAPKSSRTPASRATSRPCSAWAIVCGRIDEKLVKSPRRAHDGGKEWVDALSHAQADRRLSPDQHPRRRPGGRPCRIGDRREFDRYVMGQARNEYHRQRGSILPGPSILGRR